MSRINIASNIYIKSSWSISFCIEEPICTVQALFEGGKNPKLIITNGKKQKIELKTTALHPLFLDKGKYSLTLTTKYPINLVDLSLLVPEDEKNDLDFIPINKLIRTVDFPKLDFRIGIDFFEVLEYYGKKRINVEIMFPDGTICTVNKSSHNFTWEDDILLCDIPSGQDHRIRGRFSSEEKWSRWFQFRAKRKMTL